MGAIVIETSQSVKQVADAILELEKIFARSYPAYVIVDAGDAAERNCTYSLLVRGETYSQRSFEFEILVGALHNGGTTIYIPRLAAWRAVLANIFAGMAGKSTLKEYTQSKTFAKRLAECVGGTINM
ncbi:MAG: hypothetical protein LBQ80_05700 [Clostridium sp.]|jgi:hypothetical protein|nr:hypothetical protein [Clostridium sp.]